MNIVTISPETIEALNKEISCLDTYDRKEEHEIEMEQDGCKLWFNVCVSTEVSQWLEYHSEVCGYESRTSREVVNAELESVYACDQDGEEAEVTNEEHIKNLIKV